MRQIPRYLKLSIVAALVLFISGLMMACGPTAPLPAPRSIQERGELAVVPLPTPAISASPTPTPVLLAPDDGCVSCHTSQEELIATAAEEEVQEELSEGEG
jgi:hypothetical protein